MNALDTLDDLIRSGVVRFATVGLSALDSRRHASVCVARADFVQAYGDTSEAALASAIAKIRSSRAPVKDALDDLLG